MRGPLDPCPIRISAHCEACLQTVELVFAWAAPVDPRFGAVWHCPHCGEKQGLDAVGRVVQALKTA